MSRFIASAFLAMLVLAGAMSLKTVVLEHGNGTRLMVNGGGSPPPPPPFPPRSFKNGGGSPPPPPFPPRS